MQKYYYVYILTNSTNTTLYTGITSNLPKRVWEHKNKVVTGFTHKYNINKLVYYEQYFGPYNAIKREKRIKKYNRLWKVRLIEKNNPYWKDLYGELL